MTPRRRAARDVALVLVAQALLVVLAWDSARRLARGDLAGAGFALAVLGGGVGAVAAVLLAAPLVASFRAALRR